jgi:signal transduction histidine kinase
MTRFLPKRLSHRIGVVFAVALGLTALVVTLPSVRFAYEQASGRVALETSAALIGLFAVIVFAGRYRQSRSVADLVLVGGLGSLVCTNLFFSVLPVAAGADPGGAFTTWAPLLGRLIAAALFASSSFLHDRSVVRPGRAAGQLGVVLLALNVALGLFVFLAADLLPAGLAPPPQSSIAPELDLPVISALQGLSFLTFGLAALGLVRRGSDSRDPVFAWLAAGSALACCAALNYVLYPSLYSNWLYTGDAFRLGSYLAFLLGAVAELRREWHELAGAAVLEERRRIARGLHDGVAQELAFIGRRAQRLSGAEAERIREAAERGLAESRRTLAVLSRPLDEPFEDVLTEAVEIAAQRGPARVRLDIEAGIFLSHDHREALALIAREAVSNAARHSRATVISVAATRQPTLTLRVEDDGCGFERADSSQGYGLRIMEERARAIGGEFRVSTGLGRGTCVEVTVK